jgi:hypothetical protein
MGKGGCLGGIHRSGEGGRKEKMQEVKKTEIRYMYMFEDSIMKLTKH